MKLKWTCSNKNFIKFLVLLIVMGILVGIFLYLNENDLIKTSINSQISNLNNLIKTTHQNNILSHLIIISSLIILSFTVIGLPIILFYFFYEGVSLGFLISTLIKYKGLNGLLFSAFFILINKLIYFLILVYLIINTFKYSKKMLHNIKENKSEILINHLIKCAFTLGVSLITDFIIYLLGNKILGIFLFLI